MNELDILYAFRHGDPLLIGVFVTLLLMSVATWAIAAGKVLTVLGARRQNRATLQAFEQAQTPRGFRTVIPGLSGPLASIAQDGYHAFDHYRGVRDGRDKAEQQLDDHVVRMIRQSMDRETLRMQAGSTLLASVGSLAPFIGLLGTVWGIHAALMDISREASVSMDLVAGPLGEALIATAAGLGAAIPAVAFYNFFQRAQRLQQQTLEAFAHDLHALLMHSDLEPGRARRTVSEPRVPEAMASGEPNGIRPQES